jgi:hypothetical protein
MIKMSEETNELKVKLNQIFNIANSVEYSSFNKIYKVLELLRQLNVKYDFITLEE